MAKARAAPGPSIKWPRVYYGLRAKRGMTKEKAAAISNAMYNKHGGKSKWSRFSSRTVRKGSAKKSIYQGVLPKVLNYGKRKRTTHSAYMKRKKKK